MQRRKGKFDRKINDAKLQHLRNSNRILNLELICKFHKLE